ncbi:MAG: hypothetical protein M1835_006593 [Candelina submexicana]|nr:MAG: hypothetical protein M1835_006593 [Candelina submexicana]
MDFFGDDETEEEPPKLRFRPCIAELMRTEYCAPSIILLVHRIKIVDVEGPHGTLQAYRVWFGDGEKVIQGILKKETHRFMITEETTVGSYVMLDEYELRRSKRSNGNGEVAHLAIQNFHTVGQEEGMREREEVKQALRDQAKRKKAEEHDTSAGGVQVIIEPEDSPQSSNKRRKLDHGMEIGPVREQTDVLGTSSQNEKLSKDEDQLKASSAQSSFDEKENAATPPVQPPLPQTPAAGRKRGSSWLDEPPVHTSNSHQGTSSETRNLCEPQDRQERRITLYEDRYATALHHTPLLPLEATIEADYPRPPHTTKPVAPAQRPTAIKRSALTQPLPSKPIPRPKRFSQPLPPPKPILRPLTLTALSSLPTLPKQQNQLLDVLALVVAVSPQTVKRPNMPLKRDIRLFDLSTPKRVALSVFVDAESFVPDVGTVAVFRSVKNHRWDGGSLNAYPGDCEGFKWFLPLGADGGGEGVDAVKVKALRDWWLREKERVREEEEEEEEEREKGKLGENDVAEKV